ncbi:MAG: hypothetical protein DWP97_02510 [Calditrichaeota bacterium]|nr:MAG: hypothetical protein DWP97_02510 [Calditrichota bacterium]
MFRFSKLLVFTALVVTAGLFVGGCEQPDDVVTPNTKAQLTLVPERLPTNPPNTVYQLWVANSSDTISLGRFKFDFETKKFLETTGTDRVENGRFYLDENVNNYSHILVSVEEASDLDNSPSAIMLIDAISNTTVRMVFPLSKDLTAATVRYNMKSTSDGDSDETSNDGRSIWFAIFDDRTRFVQDTFGIDSFVVEDDVMDTVIVPTPVINIIGIDTSTIVIQDTAIEIGLDTVMQSIVRYSPILRYDTVNYVNTSMNVYYQVGPVDTISYDFFSQDDYALPDYTSYGWKYKGWVVSDVIDSTAVGTITLPAWEFYTTYLNESAGGLLTTGIFRNIEEPDSTNPYVNVTYKNPPRVPQFPGEDFLENLPGGLSSIPNLGNQNGHVFVSLEPNFYDDSTNFPLIVFSGDLPGTSNLANLIQHAFTLDGLMSTNNDFVGFPAITVQISEF